MQHSFQIGNKHLIDYNKNWLRFLIWGMLLVILGAAAISATVFSTLLSVVILGFFIFAGGVVVIVDTFSFWLHKWQGFFLHLLMGILYVGVGLMLIGSPGLSAISLTLLLAILFIFIGIFRIAYSLSHRLTQWGWNLFNGLISLLLGLLILASWPASSLFIIGLFVGIDLVFAGVAYLMIAFTARSQRVLRG